MTTLSLIAKQDYLEKVARTRDPIRAISEFVWNALDADATSISVEFGMNVLGGIQEIVIRDNGVGINHTQAARDFGRLGDSWKRTSHRSPKLQRALHGKEGRGRLRFFSLAEKGRWRSVFKDKAGMQELVIEILAGALEKCDVSDPSASSCTDTGTVVELAPLKETFDWLLGREAFLEFNAVFASYILQYPGVSISYNGRAIDPADTILQSYEFPKQTIVGPHRRVEDLSLKVIEWNSATESRKIYLGGETGIVLGSQAAHVQAPGFEFSAYANSTFFQEMADANLLELDDLSDPDFTFFMEHIRDRLGDYFRQRQAERSRGLIEDLKSEGAYPYEGDPRDEVERRERDVFDIATYAVSSYSREFKRADTSLRKMTLTLLREAIRHNPDALSIILRAVVNLPKFRQDEFSSLLQKTELGNIITASSLIADRVTTLQVLSSMVFSPQHRSTVKERGELDAVVRDNTWLFGERFHITLPEAGLTRVMERVAEELGSGRAPRRVRKPDGATGRLDCFLGRSVPHPDQNRREFIVLELKRPSLKIGREELNQLEDYVKALKSQPDFARTDTYWNFYLVTGEYDPAISDRITQKDRPVGLFLENENSRVWVKTWSELIRECEGRLQFIQDKLRVEVSGEEIEQRIAVLRTSLQGGQAAKVVPFPGSESKVATAS
jgi:hypothetical protein